MNEKWFVATYKINEVKRLETNLINQKFEYYLPKIFIKNINSALKEEALFPGYVFVNTSVKNYSALKYTMGISMIIKFGDNIALMSNEDIKAIEIAEQASKIDPLSSQIQIGQEAIILKGSLKGNIVKICSLPSKERAGILLSFLGSIREVTIPKKDLIL
jgi:transcriptional antiterminator RfaH